MANLNDNTTMSKQGRGGRRSTDGQQTVNKSGTVLSTSYLARYQPDRLGQTRYIMASTWCTKWPMH